METVAKKSLLLGNGININFGGDAYSNAYIIKRILFNARANKYDLLFDGKVSGDEIASIFVELATWANDISAGKYDAIIPSEEKITLEDFKKRYKMATFSLLSSWTGRLVLYSPCLLSAE